MKAFQDANMALCDTLGTVLNDPNIKVGASLKPNYDKYKKVVDAVSGLTGKLPDMALKKIEQGEVGKEMNTATETLTSINKQFKGVFMPPKYTGMDLPTVVKGMKRCVELLTSDMSKNTLKLGDTMEPVVKLVGVIEGIVK